jgi:hypothetical protein
MKTEPKNKELLSLQKENRHLKQSIAVMRDQLEGMRIAREEAVQNTLRAAQDEMTQLRATIAAMRDELEKACYEKDCIIEQQAVDSSDENKQMKDAITALRSELDRREAAHQEEIQVMNRNHHGEVQQLQQTAKVLREKLVALKTTKP